MKLIVYGIFASLASVSVSTHAKAAPSQSALQDIAACRALESAAARLSCFDTTTRVLEDLGEAATPAITEAPSQAEAEAEADAPADAPPVATAPPGDRDDSDDIDPIAAFGAEDMAPARDEDRLKELRIAATSITRNNRGKYIVTLENGQVWRQLQGDGNELRIRKDMADGPIDVIIKKRALGAYSLRLTTARRSILVRRIK